MTGVKTGAHPPTNAVGAPASLCYAKKHATLNTNQFLVYLSVTQAIVSHSSHVHT